MWANNMKKSSTLLIVKNSQGTKTAFRLHLKAAAAAPWRVEAAQLPCGVAGDTQPTRSGRPFPAIPPEMPAQTQGDRSQHTAWRPLAGGDLTATGPEEASRVRTEALGRQPPALNRSLGVKADNSKPLKSLMKSI